MKKIPTLFEREFENHRIVRILPNISPDLAWVMAGDGVATIKWDGACCAVINGVFYKRYDAKHGKPIPSNAIKCQENADPVTGHLPCWVPCDRTATGDKWFWDAYDRMGIVPDGTYEAIGPHFRANPYNLDADVLKPHGKDIVELDRSFEGIRTYLETHVIEGIVSDLEMLLQKPVENENDGYISKDLLKGLLVRIQDQIQIFRQTIPYFVTDRSSEMPIRIIICEL